MAGMASVRVVPQLLEPPPARHDRPSFPAARVRLGPVDIQIFQPLQHEPESGHQGQW